MFAAAHAEMSGIGGSADAASRLPRCVLVTHFCRRPGGYTAMQSIGFEKLPTISEQLHNLGDGQPFDADPGHGFGAV